MYTFDGTTVAVQVVDGRVGIRWTDAVDPVVGLIGELWWPMISAIDETLESTLEGYARAGSISRWTADRMAFVARKCLADGLK